jgi:MYXO-CTERM domain-containing protein
MMFKKSLAGAAVAMALVAWGTAAHADASFSEGFNGVTVPSGWVTTNLSTRASTGNLWSVGPGITDANSNIVVAPFEGDGMAIVNYTSVGSGTGTINNWLISPLITGMQNGDTFSFYTTTTPASAYPDRMEFRLSTSGSSTTVGTTTTSVGVFTTTLLSINPTLLALPTVGAYPDTWTQYTVTLSGLAGPTDGRVAFRYFVTSGGPTGANSNIIAVDAFNYTSVSAVPEAATWAMMFAGVGALGLVRRRRDSAQA